MRAVLVVLAISRAMATPPACAQAPVINLHPPAVKAGAKARIVFLDAAVPR